MISRETTEHYVWGGICDGWHSVNTAEAVEILPNRKTKKDE